jgi:hypothetical protein
VLMSLSGRWPRPSTRLVSCGATCADCNLPPVSFTHSAICSDRSGPFNAGRFYIAAPGPPAIHREEVARCRRHHQAGWRSRWPARQPPSASRAALAPNNDRRDGGAVPGRGSRTGSPPLLRIQPGQFPSGLTLRKTRNGAEKKSKNAQGCEESATGAIGRHVNHTRTESRRTRDAGHESNQVG